MGQPPTGSGEVKKSNLLTLSLDLAKINRGLDIANNPIITAVDLESDDVFDIRDVVYNQFHNTIELILKVREKE